MALALYRTYRPGSLADVVGQEHVTGPLARALTAGRIHHAYLLSGPRGCGKTSTARILARSLNCEAGPTPTPCGTCRSCVELAPNGPGSMDVVEMDAATHRGVDDARDLREKAVYAPAASRFRVYIIDEAHQLTSDAANALLKLVEEPPAHLRFIFATTEPDKIIPTIRSRTFHYGFRLVPTRVLADHLAVICRAEEVSAEPAALALIARAGGGSVRDSLSVLGQLVAGVGPEGLTHAEVVSALGVTDVAVLDDFVSALANRSTADLLTVVDRVVSAGHDPRRFVGDVLDRLRDLIVLQADPDAVEHGLLDLPPDLADTLVSQAADLGLAELSQAADLVSAGMGDMRGATAPRLQLELLCARLALPSGSLGVSDLLARVDRLERALAAGVPAQGAGAQAHTPPDTPDAAQGAVTSTPPSSGSASLPELPGGRAVGGGPPRPPALRNPGQRSQRPPAGANALPPGPSPSPPAPVEAPPAPAHAHAQAPNEPSQPATTPAPREPSKPASSTPASTGTSDLARVRAAWPTVLDRLAAGSRVAWTLFHAAQPVSVSDSVLAVAVTEAGNARAITGRGYDERLRQALIDVLGLDVSIDVLHEPDPARPPARSGVAGPAPAPAPAPETGGVGRTPRPGTTPPAGDEGSRAEQVRAASAGSRRAQTTAAEPDDEPSPDDPDVAPADPVALITRELGGRPIGRIDHT